MKVVIRKFEPNDAEAVSGVIRRTMRETNSRDYPLEILAPLIEYFSPEKVLALARERICLVAEIDEGVVGTAALEGDHLQTFFVAPDRQGKGVGTALMKGVEEAARKNRIKTVKLASSLTAVEFYEKTGFRKTGIDKEETAGKQIGMEKYLS